MAEQQTLRQNDPERFGHFSRQYEQLLSRSAELRHFPRGPERSEWVRQLAKQLGRQQARPRDVIELHRLGLERLMREATGWKARALLEEGRLLVLELMGCLADYYRERSGPAPGSAQDSGDGTRA